MNIVFVHVNLECSRQNVSTIFFSISIFKFSVIKLSSSNSPRKKSILIIRFIRYLRAWSYIFSTEWKSSWILWSAVRSHPSQVQCTDADGSQSDSFLCWRWNNKKNIVKFMYTSPNVINEISIYPIVSSSGYTIEY